MNVGSISGSAGINAALTAPGPQTTNSTNNVPKVDNDGDGDNGSGADDQAKAAVTLNTAAASSNPSRGQALNTTA